MKKGSLRMAAFSIIMYDSKKLIKKEGPGKFPVYENIYVKKGAPLLRCMLFPFDEIYHKTKSCRFCDRLIKKL